MRTAARIGERRDALTCARAAPSDTLKSFGPSPAKTFNELKVMRTWTPQRDLLNSRAGDENFVVEVETDGAAYLRFGDGRFGSRPDADERFLARYRIGNGARGNVGAESLAHLVSDDPGITDQVIAGVSNPLPARAALTPRPSSRRAQPRRAHSARKSAPSPLRITPPPRCTAALGVQRAAATFRWTGSWRTVFLTADRLGGRGVDVEFESEYAAAWSASAWRATIWRWTTRASSPWMSR